MVNIIDYLANNNESSSEKPELANETSNEASIDQDGLDASSKNTTKQSNATTSSTENEKNETVNEENLSKQEAELPKHKVKPHKENKKEDTGKYHK